MVLPWKYCRLAFLVLALCITLTYCAEQCYFDKPKAIITDEGSCKRHCDQERECTHYEYEIVPYWKWKGTVRCYIYKSTLSKKVDTETMMCGVKDNWRNYDEGVIGQNCLFLEKFYTTSSSNTSKTCLQSCELDSSCTHFNFYRNLNMDDDNVSQCRLLSGNHQGKKGAIHTSNLEIVECGFLHRKASILEEPTTGVKEQVYDFAEDVMSFCPPWWSSWPQFLAGLMLATLIFLLHWCITKTRLNHRLRNLNQIAQSNNKQNQKKEMMDENLYGPHLPHHYAI